MATPLEDVTGIGPATAKVLAEHGIASAEDLAARQVEEIALVHGFSTIRAAQVVAAARDLFVLKPVVAETEPSAPGKVKKANKGVGKKPEKTDKKDKKKGHRDKKKDAKKKGKKKAKKSKK